MSKVLFERHIRKPIEFKFKNEETGIEDSFYFKPLNMEQIQIVSKIGKMNKLYGNESPESVEGMFELFKSIVKESYSDLDDETIEDFITTNMNEMPRVLEELSPKSTPNKIKEVLGAH